MGGRQRQESSNLQQSVQMPLMLRGKGSMAKEILLCFWPSSIHLFSERRARGRLVCHVLPGQVRGVRWLRHGRKADCGNEGKPRQQQKGISVASKTGGVCVAGMPACACGKGGGHSGLLAMA